MKFMENFIKLMLAFGIGLLLVLLAMPKVIPFLHKMKFGQVEREEGLESHKEKRWNTYNGWCCFCFSGSDCGVCCKL